MLCAPGQCQRFPRHQDTFSVNPTFVRDFHQGLEVSLFQEKGQGSDNGVLQMRSEVSPSRVHVKNVVYTHCTPLTLPSLDTLS